jgi:hypothetical protein
MTQSKGKKSGLRAVEEWVGGTVTMPNYVMEETPYRPEIVLWLDATNDLIVGSDLFEPGVPPEVCRDVLLKTMQKPMAGPPRRPTSIRVSDPAVADLVGESVGDEIQVKVAPTPELDRLVEMMAASMPKGDDDKLSYFEDGRVSLETVELFFRAAAELWRAAPWELVYDSHILQLDCPDLGAEGKCISILGNLGESFGVLVFESIESFEIMTRRGEAMTSGEPPRDLGGSVFSINFEQGSDIPKGMRREVSKHRWEVPDPNAYPRIQWIDRDKLLRPLTDPDVVFATACSQAIARFFERHLDEDAFESATEQFVLDDLPGKPTVKITAPYPGVVWRHGSDEDDDDDDLDEEFAIGQAIVEDFVQTQAARGRAANWLDAASFICESLYNFKVFHIDGVAHGWTAALVEEYLLGYFPQQMAANEKLIQETPDVVAAYFAWLEAEGEINSRTGQAIQKRVKTKRKRFLREAHNPYNFGPAKMMATAMMEAGVDLTDEAQVNEFIAAQNAELAAAMDRQKETTRTRPGPDGVES